MIQNYKHFGIYNNSCLNEIFIYKKVELKGIKCTQIWI